MVTAVTAGFEARATHRLSCYLFVKVISGMRPAALFLTLSLIWCNGCARRSSESDERILKSNIKRDASMFVAAWNNRNIDGLIALLSERSAQNGAHARDIERRGIEQVYDYLKYIGMPNVQVSLDEPKPPKRYGNLYASFVPIVAVADSPEAKITIPSYLLGVSSDEGENWKFVVLFKVEQKQIDTLFPEFEKKLQIPVSSSVPPQLEYKSIDKKTKHTNAGP